MVPPARRPASTSTAQKTSAATSASRGGAYSQPSVTMASPFQVKKPSTSAVAAASSRSYQGTRVRDAPAWAGSTTKTSGSSSAANR